VLTHEEIRRIWDACETQNPYVCAWFRLRLVTAQRGGELLQMRSQDIDDKSHFWSIPAEFVNNAHGHRVYLNTLALKVLETVPRFVISRILNHSEEKDITSVYDRYSYDAEKKAAMEFWNRQLSAVLKSRSASMAGRFTMRSADECTGPTP
jgi:integrase